MPISFVGTGAVAIGANPTVTVPAGVVKGDLLLIIGTATSSATSTPTGWSLLAAQGAGQFLTVWFKYATASETSVVVTFPGTFSKAFMLAFRGAGAFQLSSTFATGVSISATTSTLTTTYNNAYVVSIFTNVSGGTRTLTTPTGTTLAQTSGTTSGANGILAAYELKAAAGASTARTSNGYGNTAWSALQIAFVETRTAVYWVGGNGTWTAPGIGVTGANWSNTSGGAGGVLVPSINDNVIVNGSSGSPTITLSGVPVCESLTTTGATCTISSTGTLQVNGPMTLSATTTWSATGTLTFIGTGTVTTNGVSIASPITFNGPSQTLTLGDNLTSTGAFTFTASTLALGTNTLNVSAFSFGGVNTRSITFGSGSAINITGNAATVWSAANATGFSTTGTPTVNFTYSGATGTRTIVHGTTGGTETTGRIDFNVTAGTDAVTFTTGSDIRTLNTTGYSGTITPNALILFGSLTYGSGTTVGSGLILFASTTTGNTVTTNGKTVAGFTFSGVGGAWTLQDNVTSSAGITLTAGSLTTNDKTINATVFSSSNSNARTLNLGASTINLSSTTTAWNFATTTNLTFNSGTSQINVAAGGSPDFEGGGLTYYNVNFAAPTLSFTIFGNNTFNTLSSPGGRFDLILTGTTQTVTNFNVDGTSYSNYITLTGGTLSKSSGTASLSFAQINTAATGGATWNAFGCQQFSAAATGWNFGAQTRYLIGSGAINGFNTANRWSTTSGGSANAMYPWQFDDVLFDANSGSVTFTIDESTASIKSLNTTGFAGALATDLLATNAPDLFVYGNFIVGSSTTFTSGTDSFVLHLSGTSSGNVLTMGSSNKNLNGGLTLNCSSGSYTITTNITVNDLALTSGTLSFGSNTITTLTLSDGTSTGNVTLNLNSSTVTVRGSVRLIDVLTTVNAGTSTINLFPISDVTAFSFNSNKTFNNVIIDRPNASATVTFNSSPTIAKLSSTRLFDYSILITNGQTLTVGQFDIRGEPGTRYVTVNSTSGTATLASLGGAVQSNINYVDFFNIIATPSPTATGTVPYYWYIGENSTQNAATTGVVFSSDTSYTYYNLTSGTSWSVPANWNSSDNNVYLIGGGGGGSGSVVASSTGSHNSGSGGGGGGFTALTNTTLTPGGTVSYAIGAAGAAGTGSTSSSTAGGGGTTTFNISNTAGGGGGAATGLGTATVGAAGTGSTFNGGTGGPGTPTTLNTTNAGGGGAGSGGLNGAGGAGGFNIGATIGLGGAGNNSLGDYLFVSGAQYGDGGNGGSTTGAGVAATGRGGGGGGGGTTAGSATVRAGALGTQGVIVVRYRTGSLAGTGNFLTFFYQ